MDDFIYVGKIVNTHGLKGEIRILSDFEYKEKVFVPGMTIYIVRKKEPTVGAGSLIVYSGVIKLLRPW